MCVCVYVCMMCVAFSGAFLYTSEVCMCMCVCVCVCVCECVFVCMMCIAFSGVFFIHVGGVPNVCVLSLLYMYVSGYCYICVLVQLYICQILVYVSSY